MKTTDNSQHSGRASLERQVMQHCQKNLHTSIKDAELLNLFTGNPFTVDKRASRTLARLHKAGLLKRKKISLEASMNDGTRWLYCYEAA